jgi:prepilin-type N-terminal cleavage/methylation domain-containing protein
MQKGTERLMARERITTQTGFTLIELIIAVTASLIVMLGLALVLANSQESWNQLYTRSFSDVVGASNVAGRKFKAIIRKACRDGFILDDNGKGIEVYYFNDESSADVDRYAHFYELDGDLNLELGTLNPRETLEIQTISTNVSECFFTAAGRSAQMVLTLDNDSRKITTVSCAFLHN